MKTTPDRLLSIDCLRGVAALAVFVFHVSVIANFPKRTLPPFTLLGRTYANLISPLSLGASGVNLFFVISGFCLALQQWRSASIPLARYARNRVARIGPAYWLTVLISAGLVVALGRVGHGPAAPLWFVTDVLLHGAFLHGVHPRTFLSLHGGLWSMATEVQFYVLFPLLLSLCSRIGGLRFVLLAALCNGLFRVAVAFYPFPETHAISTWSALLSYQLPGRLLEFALGMWLAELYLRRDVRAASLFRVLWLPTLLVALYCRGFGPPYLPDMALGLFYFSLCGAVLLRPHGSQGGSWSAFTVWAARFGRASYSFFLIHYPVLVILSLVCPAPEEAYYTRFFFLLLFALPASVAAGTALYLFVELPLWQRWRA